MKSSDIWLSSGLSLLIGSKGNGNLPFIAKMSFHVFNMCSISSAYSVFRDCLHIYEQSIFWKNDTLTNILILDTALSL